MGPRAGLDRCGKARPHRDSIPGPSSPQRVAIPITLSRPVRELMSIVNVLLILRTVHFYAFIS